MKKNDKKGGVSKSGMLAVGVGLAAVGAGAYYMLGPNSKEHQKKVSKLVSKIEKEVKSEIKKAEKITMPIYHKAVDVITENYSKQYNMHEKEIKAIAKKLKSEWKDIAKLADKKVKKSIRSIKKRA